MNMNKKVYVVPMTGANKASLRCSLLAGSISDAQKCAGVPEDTPHINPNPIQDGGSFD